MELSKEQQIAYNKYIQGINVFITGPGGTGKSALIRQIYAHANQRHQNIQVTAMTGCAAVLLNCKAKTLHSWAGIGLGNASVDTLITKLKKNKYAANAWRETRILIVDEVSMLSLKLFDMLNALGMAIRNNYSKPFGGIQLIFSGDFYQLPPVGNKDDPDTMRFCFESDDWNSVFHRDSQIQLTKIYRQTDETYTSILNQIREGKIKRKSNDILMQHVGRTKDPNTLIIEPTKLYPTKSKVEQINTSKMNELKTKEKTYEVKYVKDMDAFAIMTMSKEDKDTRRQYTPQEIQTELDYLASNLTCDISIKIKQGAQVMCIINIKDSEGHILVCNGSQGIVQGFCEITGFPLIRFNNGYETIMTRHTWLSEKIPGVSVSQVPLILAWALTIHKSQGATLDAAEIDVGSGIFECGQTYVALSRVKSLEGLYLTSFDPRKIRINKKVQDYYESLKTYQESNSTNNEVYVPLVIAEPLPVATPLNTSANTSTTTETTRTTLFEKYTYVEADARIALPEEMKEEPYVDM
jgi:ATP-dependent DNA helicase PIF1